MPSRSARLCHGGSGVSVTVQYRDVTVSHSGSGPYVARSASDKRDDWVFWFVADATGFNGLSFSHAPGAKFVSRAVAEALAKLMNEATQ